MRRWNRLRRACLGWTNRFEKEILGDIVEKPMFKLQNHWALYFCGTLILISELLTVQLASIMFLRRIRNAKWLIPLEVCSTSEPSLQFILWDIAKWLNVLHSAKVKDHKLKAYALQSSVNMENSWGKSTPLVYTKSSANWWDLSSTVTSSTKFHPLIPRTL